ncbi:hypothetical protein MMC14_010621 [Varicellaria rhodocarpa]|nr:hypothetical protein [Varicellaria rhodocarpa]
MLEQRNQDGGRRKEPPPEAEVSGQWQNAFCQGNLPEVVVAEIGIIECQKSSERGEVADSSSQAFEPVIATLTLSLHGVKLSATLSEIAADLADQGMFRSMQHTQKWHEQPSANCTSI